LLDAFNASTALNTTLWASEVSGTGATAPKLAPAPTGSDGYAVSAVNSGSARRSELTVRSSSAWNAKISNDKEHIITFSTYIKQYDTANPPSWLAFNQYHAVPHLLSTGKPDWTCVAGRNPVTLTMQNGSYAAAINTTPATVSPSGAIANRVWSTPFTVGKWVNWTIRLIPSQTSKGVVQVWKDGVLVTSYFGRNMDTNDKCGYPQSPYVFFKMGIYKDSSNTATQNIIFDNVKIAVK